MNGLKLTAMQDAFLKAGHGATVVLEAKRNQLVAYARRNLGNNRKVIQAIHRINNLDDIARGFEVVRESKQSSEAFFEALDHFTA